MVVALLGGLAAIGALGSGFSSSVLESLPGSAWLVSNDNGDALLASGADGKGAARIAVPGAAGSSMSVVHRGGYACVRVEAGDGTATVNCIDDATFGDAGSARVSQDQSVIRTGGHAYMVNEPQGLVRPLDPASLTPAGDPLEFEAPISATADDEGRLMVLELESSTASVVEGPTASEPVTIGRKKGDLHGLLLDGQFAVVARADAALTLFRDGAVDRRVRLPEGLGPLVVPSEVEGADLPMLERQGDRASVVAYDVAADAGRRVRVDDPLPGTAEVFATSAGLFVPDPQAGAIVRVDTRDGSTESIDLGLGKGDGNMQVFVKDGQLWINNPNGSKAVVIDAEGNLREVNKYDPDVEEVDPGWSGAPAEPSPDPAAPVDPGGTTETDAPVDAGGGSVGAGNVPRPSAPVATAPLPTAPATPGATPSGPAPDPGDPPTLAGLTATAGSRSVSLAWTVRGTVERYELTCTPSCRAPSIAAGSMQVDVEGLTNGTAYSFTLVAANAQGEDEASARATPLAGVPDQVTDVAAEAVKGTVAGVPGPVEVSWSPESGSGLPIQEYVVTATDGTTEVGPFTSDGSRSSLSVPGEELGPMDDDAEGDWRFAVRAVSRGAGGELTGEPSELSDAVDLHTIPGPPSATAAAQDGAVALSWPAPLSSGRPVSFEVNGSPASPDFDGAAYLYSITGLTNGSQQTFEVAIVDDDGVRYPGAAVTAVPAGPPIITQLTASSPAVERLKVTYAIDWNGAQGSCELTAGSRSLGCPSSGKVVSIPAGSYTIRLKASNVAGDAAQPGAWPTVRVAAPPPPKPIGEACANTPCVGFINTFTDSGKDTRSPAGPTIAKGTRREIMCKAPGLGGTYYKLGNNLWVLASDFQVINGQPVKNC